MQLSKRKITFYDLKFFYVSENNVRPRLFLLTVKITLDKKQKQKQNNFLI